MELSDIQALVADWEVTWSGTGERKIEVSRFDLGNLQHLHGLMLAAGTGRFEEACFEYNCAEAYDILKGLINGIGAATPVACDASIETRRLYRSGYEVYAAGKDVLYFLNPVPRPELFLTIDDTSFVQEFKSSL